MSEPLKLGIAGLGTVGTGVLELLNAHVGDLRDRCGRDIQVTASVDNLTDALILPQLGLPAPGRLYRIGLRLN